MSNGGRGHRPSGGNSSGKPTAPQDPNALPGGGVESDREWARERIAAHYRANRKAREAPKGQPKLPEAGASLPGDARARMQPHFGGADLSNVKVSTSGESARAADDLGARAFTVGNAIHFGAGEFAPGTHEGDRLLAHELTHTVQGARSGVQRKEQPGAEGEREGAETEAEGAEAEGAEVSQPGEPAEQEADAVGDHVAGKLHGKADAKGGEQTEPGKEKAPAIGAKLDGTKVHLAGKDPLRSGAKSALGGGPEVGAMRVGNAQQAGVGRTPRHHVLPQKFRDWFKARGVDVDQYCVELQQGDHSAIHTMDYNKALMGAMQRQEKVVKHKLKPAEILEVARGVMAQFKIDSLPFVPFQGGDDKKGKGK